MGLILPTVGTDSGLSWENGINANSSIIDGHNHSSGEGVQISPSGININANLPFNNFSATSLKSAVFTAQTSLATLLAVYCIGNDLYYNDGAGNVIQITSGGSVNATSSGISSGTATASFFGGVLIVNAAANTPANIQGGSILLGNNSPASKFLTLSPPSAMAANFGLVLPNIPLSTLAVTLDSSGNFATALLTGTQLSLTANITGSQLSSSAGIVGGQIALATITGSNIAAATVGATNLAANSAANNLGVGGVTSSLIQSNVNLGGNTVQENGKNVVVSNTNAAASLAIVRFQVNFNTGTVTAGEGVSVFGSNATQISVTTATAFAAAPLSYISPANSTAGANPAWEYLNSFGGTPSWGIEIGAGNGLYNVMLVGVRA